MRRAVYLLIVLGFLRGMLGRLRGEACHIVLPPAAPDESLAVYVLCVTVRREEDVGTVYSTYKLAGVSPKLMTPSQRDWLWFRREDPLTEFGMHIGIFPEDEISRTISVRAAVAMSIVPEGRRDWACRLIERAIGMFDGAR